MSNPPDVDKVPETLVADFSVFPAILDEETVNLILGLSEKYPAIEANTTGTQMFLNELPDLSHIELEDMDEEEKEAVRRDIEAFKQYQLENKHSAAQRDYRSCQRHEVPALQEAWLIMVLQRFAEISNEKWMLDIMHVDQMELLDYVETDDRYNWHRDCDIIGEDGRNCTRKLTMIIQLSDPEDYEGCDLQISNEGVEVDEDTDVLEPHRETVRQKGTVIVFPSFQKHRITPLLSGRRRSLVAWVIGPRWR